MAPLILSLVILSSSSPDIQEICDSIATITGLSSPLLEAIILVRTGGTVFYFQGDNIGITGLHYDLLRRYGAQDPFDPYQNAEAAARFLLDLLKENDGDTLNALIEFYVQPNPLTYERERKAEEFARSVIKKLGFIKRHRYLKRLSMKSSEGSSGTEKSSESINIRNRIPKWKPINIPHEPIKKQLCEACKKRSFLAVLGVQMLVFDTLDSKLKLNKNPQFQWGIETFPGLCDAKWLKLQISLFSTHLSPIYFRNYQASVFLNPTHSSNQFVWPSLGYFYEILKFANIGEVTFSDTFGYFLFGVAVCKGISRKTSLKSRFTFAFGGYNRQFSTETRWENGEWKTYGYESYKDRGPFIEVSTRLESPIIFIDLGMKNLQAELKEFYYEYNDEEDTVQTVVKRYKLGITQITTGVKITNKIFIYINISKPYLQFSFTKFLNPLNHHQVPRENWIKRNYNSNNTNAVLGLCLRI